jgi:hypothetical protein
MTMTSGRDEILAARSATQMISHQVTTHALEPYDTSNESIQQRLDLLCSLYQMLHLHCHLSLDGARKDGVLDALRSECTRHWDRHGLRFFKVQGKAADNAWWLISNHLGTCFEASSLPLQSLTRHRPCVGGWKGLERAILMESKYTPNPIRDPEPTLIETGEDLLTTGELLPQLFEASGAR